MNRFKLLLAAAVLVVTATATQPAKSVGCINQGSCQPLHLDAPPGQALLLQSLYGRPHLR